MTAWLVTEWIVDRLTNWMIDLLFYWFIEWLIYQLIHLSTEWLIDLMIYWMLHLLNNCFIEWLFYQSIDLLNDGSLNDLFTECLIYLLNAWFIELDSLAAGPRTRYRGRSCNPSSRVGRPGGDTTRSRPRASTYDSGSTSLEPNLRHADSQSPR